MADAKQQNAEAELGVGRVNVGDAVVVADELGEDDVVENGDDDGLRIRDRFGDNEDRVLEEELGEDRLQEFLAVDVFGFFGLAERDERDDGVIAVGRSARGRVGAAEDILFGMPSGNFAFRHFSQGQRRNCCTRMHCPGKGTSAA